MATCDASLLLSDGSFARDTYAARFGSPTGLTIERLLVDNPVYASALMSRAALEEAGGIAVDLSGTDDYDLWLRMLELGYRVAWTPQPLAVYRVRPDSLSHDAAGMARQMQLAYLRALARGRLTRGQARIARRRLRLQRAAEQIATLVACRRAGVWPLTQALRASPLLGLVAIENASRVAPALRDIRRGGG